MVATITHREKDKLPEWAVSTANQIEDLGFIRWVFDWEHPVPDMDTSKRVQVRDEKHVGQKSEVAKYAEAMRRGDKFPPGVFTKDGSIVDFNTRGRAAQKLGWPTFPVFIIQEDYDNQDDRFVIERYHLLAAAFNTGGPKPLTREELTEAIRLAASDADRWDTDAIARHLHIKRNTVTSVFAQFRAENRAQRLGIPFNGSVNASTRAMLGQRSEKLADEPFGEIARLTQDAGLTTTELSDLVKQVVAITTGDGDRLAAIATERAAREPQIANFRASNKRRPPLSNRVRLSAKFFADYADKVHELVDTNPNTREDYAGLIDDAIDVLRSLSAAQRASLEEAS